MPVFIASLEYKVIKILNHSLDTFHNLILWVVTIKRELVFYMKYIACEGANTRATKIA